MSAAWALLRVKLASPGQPGGPGAVLSRAGGCLQAKFRFCAPQRNAGTFWICTYWGQRMAQLAEVSRPAAVARLSVSFSAQGQGNTARRGSMATSSWDKPSPQGAHVQPRARCPPHRPEGTTSPEGQQVTGPAPGLSVKVIGDAPAQKASLGGTMQPRRNLGTQERVVGTGHC